MRPLNVAMLVFNQPHRGTYWRAYYLARELCWRGHTATVISTAPAEKRRFHIRYEEHGRLALVEAPDLLPGSLRSGWDIWAAFARDRLLAAASFDLIHAFECRPAVILPALSAQRRSGTPLVIDWCDWFGAGGSVEERKSPLQRALLRPAETFFEERFRTCANETTVINTFLGRRAAELGVPPAHITLVHNGCDTADWELEPQADARATLGLAADQPLVCYVGAIFDRDSWLLARAFDAIHAQRPDTRLLVVGYCNVAIEQRVQNPEAVVRTGPLNTATLRRYLRASDVGLIPLSNSGANIGRWPLKLHTYMEAGIPFVTTNIGDLGDFVARYQCGLAANPTPHDIARQTLHLLDNRSLAQHMGATGRQLAEGELNWSRVAEQVEAVYMRCV